MNKRTNHPKTPSCKELREKISDLLREDFTDRLAELERQYKELFATLRTSQKSPPRTDFWGSVPVLLNEHQGKYNVLNAVEALAAIYLGLKLDNLQNFRDPLGDAMADDNSMVFVSGSDKPQIELGAFEVSSYTYGVQNMVQKFCELIDGSSGATSPVEKFTFYIERKDTTNSAQGRDTSVAELRTSRLQVMEMIQKIESMRNELIQVCETNTPVLKSVLNKPFETCADSSDESNSDEEQDEPRSKRRKRWEDLGKHRDTDQQRISLEGIQLRPMKGLKSMRVNASAFRKVHTDQGWGAILIDLFGSTLGLPEADAFKRLPHPMAPAFVVKAQLCHSDAAAALRLYATNSQDVEDGDTIVTQKMVEQGMEDGEEKKYVDMYEKMHNDARLLNNEIKELVRFIRSEFAFVVQMDNLRSVRRVSMSSLDEMQALVCGMMYLESISIHGEDNPSHQAHEAEEYEEDEEDGEDEEGEGGEDDDDDDGSEYANSSSDEEDEEDYDESSSDASGSEDSSDGDEEECD